MHSLTYIVRPVTQGIRCTGPYRKNKPATIISFSKTMAMRVREFLPVNAEQVIRQEFNTLIRTDADPGILMIHPREKTVILLVASLASFLVPYTGSSITVALPAMAAQFHVDAVTLGWITSAYIISAAIFIVPFGRLADIRGRKKIFTIGVGIFILASLACAFAPTENLLIAARFCQGIGGAMLFATSVAIVTQVYGPGERGWALGITIATVYAGLSVGPFIGGILTDHFGWPAIFLINVPIGIATILLTLAYVRHEWADAEGEQFDIYGSVIYGSTLFCGIFGLLLLPDLPVLSGYVPRSSPRDSLSGGRSGAATRSSILGSSAPIEPLRTRILPQ